MLRDARVRVIATRLRVGDGSTASERECVRACVRECVMIGVGVVDG